MNTKSSKLAQAEAYLKEMRTEFRAREEDYFRKSRVANATEDGSVVINLLDTVVGIITIPPIFSMGLAALQGGQAMDLRWAKSKMEQAKSKMDAADAEVRRLRGETRLEKFWGLGCILLVLALVTLTTIGFRKVTGREMSEVECKWLIRAATIAVSGGLWLVYGLATWRFLLLSALGVLMAARWNPGQTVVEKLVAVVVSFCIACI